MMPFEPILKTALHRVTDGSHPLSVDALHSDTDILAAVDSFTVVNLLLESETVLEENTGRYVSLADEHIFDAGKSPLLRWADWVQYVERRHAA